MSIYRALLHEEQDACPKSYPLDSQSDGLWWRLHLSSCDGRHRDVQMQLAGRAREHAMHEPDRRLASAKRRRHRLWLLHERHMALGDQVRGLFLSDPTR